jgi:hypothetical protein
MEVRVKKRRSTEEQIAYAPAQELSGRLSALVLELKQLESYRVMDVPGALPSLMRSSLGARVKDGNPVRVPEDVEALAGLVMRGRAVLAVLPMQPPHVAAAWNSSSRESHSRNSSTRCAGIAAACRVTAANPSHRPEDSFIEKGGSGNTATRTVREARSIAAGACAGTPPPAILQSAIAMAYAVRPSIRAWHGEVSVAARARMMPGSYQACTPPYGPMIFPSGC